MNVNRDNFTRSTRNILAGRAGHRCSLCKTPTIGPSDEAPDRIMDIGVAAHITAAAAGQGARRYDPSITSEQRRSVDNGIWLCQTCSVVIDRDEVRFTEATLRSIRRDHTEFVRLGTSVDAEVGLVAIGSNILAAGQFTRFEASDVVVRLPFFLEGSATDVVEFIRRFNDVPRLNQYILSSELGVGGLLEQPPTLDRDGTAWKMTFRWQPEAPRLHASKLQGSCSHTGKFISGAPYWKQYFERVLARPTGTWFADMDGGSHISELYERLHGSRWFEHVVKCELVRLASVPAPHRVGSSSTDHPPLLCVRKVHDARITETNLSDGYFGVAVDLELEGHGRWSTDLNLFVYCDEALRTERAKGLWMSENIRRIEAGKGSLPNILPPEGWNIDDGFPE